LVRLGRELDRVAVDHGRWIDVRSGPRAPEGMRLKNRGDNLRPYHWRTVGLAWEDDESSDEPSSRKLCVPSASRQRIVFPRTQQGPINIVNINYLNGAPERFELPTPRFEV
jgi:hypothetical protein